MTRRKFLKLLTAAVLSTLILPLFNFTRTLPKRVIIAIKNGKYPGKINPINQALIQQTGKWKG